MKHTVRELYLALLTRKPGAPRLTGIRYNPNGWMELTMTYARQPIRKFNMRWTFRNHNRIRIEELYHEHRR